MSVQFGFLRPATAAMSVSLVIAAWLPPTNASAEFSLAGKTVTIYVAGGPGGGVDQFARTLAPYLTRHLPGHPAVVASNMPGGGGMQAVQYLYNVAAKDGTAIGTTNAGPVVEPILGKKQLNYDLRKFRWVGSLVKGDTICVVSSASKIKSLDDARKTEVTMASTGATSAPTRSALLMNALIGTRFKPVSGYHGGNALIAIERGEVDGICITLSSLRTTRPHWLREKTIISLVQVATDPAPEFPQVPKAMDLVKTDTERQMLELYLLPYEFNNPFYLPPGVSDEMVAGWRKAFDAAVADKAYQADAARRRQTVTPRDGADVEKLVNRMFAIPPDIVDRTIKATTPQ